MTCWPKDRGHIFIGQMTLGQASIGQMSWSLCIVTMLMVSFSMTEKVGQGWYSQNYLRTSYDHHLSKNAILQGWSLLFSLSLWNEAIDNIKIGRKSILRCYENMTPGAGSKILGKIHCCLSTRIIYCMFIQLQLGIEAGSISACWTLKKISSKLNFTNAEKWQLFLFVWILT